MKTVGGRDFLLLLKDSTFRAMSPVSLTLVFVYSDVCAFILKVNRSDVPCVCVCVCLSCRMFVLHGTGRARSSPVSRSGV